MFRTACADFANFSRLWSSAYIKSGRSISVRFVMSYGRLSSKGYLSCSLFPISPLHTLFIFLGTFGKDTFAINEINRIPCENRMGTISSRFGFRFE